VVELRNDQKQKIVLWKTKSNSLPKQGLIVQFHGNAENQASHLLSLSWLVPYGYDLISFDYRGFGQSEGSTSFESVGQDAQLVFNYLSPILKNYKYKILVGQSLGGFVLASELAKSQIQSAFDLLILDSTFFSFKQMIKGHSSLASFFVSDDTNEMQEKLERLTVPHTLIIHGDKDPVVTIDNALSAHKLIKNSTLWIVEGGHHLDVFTAHHFKYRQRLLEEFHLPINEKADNYKLKHIDKLFLASKLCPIPAREKFKLRLEQELVKFEKSLQNMQIPENCSEQCLCPLYSKIFKKLNSRKLSQAMYRQSILNEAAQKAKCIQEIAPFCKMSDFPK